MKKLFLCSLLTILGLATVFGQAQFYARTNLQVALDAEAYWVGPQAGLGVGVKWPSKWGIVSEYYGFYDKVDIQESEWFEKGWFKQKTLAVMGTYSFGKTAYKGFYVMGGLAYQVRRSEFENELGPCPDNRDFVTAALEFGNRWPVSKTGYGIAVSLKCTGPISYNYKANYMENDPWLPPPANPTFIGMSYTTEILTQLSCGIVIDRIFPKRNKEKKQ